MKRHLVCPDPRRDYIGEMHVAYLSLVEAYESFLRAEYGTEEERNALFATYNRAVDTFNAAFRLMIWRGEKPKKQPRGRARTALF